jgi:DNA-binding MarR family transcriptional regulator
MPRHSSSAAAARTSTAEKPSRKRTAAGMAPRPELDVLSGSLGYAIKQAQVRTYEVFFRVTAPAELSPARVTALSIIGTEPGISQSALAVRLRITEPSLVKVIHTLEQMGLVQRQAHEIDRRRHALVLTTAGRVRLKLARQLIDQYESEISADLTSEEYQHLLQLLAKVASKSRGPASSRDEENQ